jgi:hypothetical protein
MIHFLLRSVRIAAISMLQLPSAMMRITLSANWSLPVPADARVMRGFDILVSETRSRTIYDLESETRDRAVTLDLALL